MNWRFSAVNLPCLLSVMNAVSLSCLFLLELWYRTTYGVKFIETAHGTQGSCVIKFCWFRKTRDRPQYVRTFQLKQVYQLSTMICDRSAGSRQRTSTSALWLTEHLALYVLWAFTAGVNQPGWEADHSRPTGPDVKNIRATSPTHMSCWREL
jgi:hypothetical protein